MKRHSGIVWLLLAWQSCFSLSGQGGGQELKVTLRDQSLIAGKAISLEITIHTSLGALTIPINQIESISYSQGLQSLAQVKTRNRNLIRGITYQSIALQSKGITHEFMASSIQTLEALNAKESTSENQASQYVILRDGSMLSGRVLQQSIPFASGSRHEEIEIPMIESLRFGRNPKEVTIHQRDGSQREAKIEIDVIQFRLDLTAEIDISIWDIQAVHCREGFTPVKVQQAFAGDRQSPLNRAPTPPPFDNLVWIPPGRFTLGSETNELGRGSDEGPQTEVTLTHGFWMSKFEVTQAEYTALLGSNPSTFQQDNQQPVEKVSWHDALAFCRQKTTAARDAGSLPVGLVFRLPTESEWEYACRAGSSTRYSYGNDLSNSDLMQYAWFVENSDSSPHPVGRLEPNPWGLHDMHGNVWEWCYDQWQYAYPGGKTDNFSAAEDGWLRVARGGSWLYSADNCRSANRDDYGPNNRCSDIGFRFVLAAPLDR